MTSASDDQGSMPDGQDRVSSTYAIGDLHGEVTLHTRLLERLAPRQEDTLIFLGDYLDRGENALATIETLTQLRTSCHCSFVRQS